MKTIKITLSFFMLSVCCFAQYTITGRVISQADTKPVAGANVFLSNTTMGDHTAADGTFTIANVKPGEYQIAITSVGFDSYTQTVIVNRANTNLQTITIFPKSIALAAVTIKSRKKGDSDRARYLEWFKGEFLGMTDTAKECKLVNPELLDFNYDNANNTLTATSADFLIIQNNSLGYTVKYLLTNFSLTFDENQNHIFSYSGSAQFERMKGSPAQEKQWQRRRQQFYENSQMHFLRSAIAGTLDQEGFRVLRVPANPQRPADSIIQEKVKVFGLLKNDKKFRDSLKYWEKKAALPRTLDKIINEPLKKIDFIKGPDKHGFFYMIFNGDDFFITYNKDKRFNRSARSKLSSAENRDNTLMSSSGPVLAFDKNGSPVNAAGMTYDGVWIRGRVAGLLPLNYEPQEAAQLAIDSGLVKKITAKFTAYSDRHNTEKAYLHFDKSYYTAGDTMYFKAYITEGEVHQLSHRSGVLYAELINERNKVSNSIRMLISNGVAWGDFALPPNLPKGNYRVRAYTQWMRNEGSESFFDKTITIGTTLTTPIPESGVPAAQPLAAKPDIKFFPEGGDLVAGVRSKMAFKAIGQNGLGIDVKGVVLDNEGKEMATFTSAHLGMGYFYLIPAEGKSYTAKVSYPDGTQDAINLPGCAANAISFDFTDLTRSYAVKISSSKQFYLQNKGKSYTLVIYAGGIPQSTTFKLDNPEVEVNVVKDYLHSGIARATLFSAEGEPLCERLLFVQANDLLALNLKSDKPTYSAREKTTLTLNALTGENGPTAGHFSVAVIDESKAPVDENSESTIVNNLLLTSELKGYIEQPNYYFTNVSERTAADLDLVMLTHGYRRYEWKNILNNDSRPMAYGVEKGLSVSGQVKFGGKPLEKAAVKLFSKGKNGLMLDTLSDTNGRFVFDNLSFNDSTKFVLQARTAKGQKDVDVKPDTTISTPDIIAGFTLQPQVIEALSTYEQNAKKFRDEQDKQGINAHTQMLKEVTVKEKKIDYFEHSENLNGKGNADQVITSDWLEQSGYTRLYDAIRAKAASLIFTPNHKIRSNRTVITGFDNKAKPYYMLLIVDGQAYDNGEEVNLGTTGYLDEIDAADVESVEIELGAHGGAIYGNQGAGGVIIVTTKKARKINNYFKESPGVITFRLNGFYKAREFYAPKYEHTETGKNNPDLRSTVYWNPEFVTDKAGNASLSYYNADGKGNYRVVIEGVDAEGNLGRQVFRYKVE